MPVALYISKLRAHVGHDLLLLPGSSAIVHDDAGRVLLARRGDNGRWSLPAGMIDPGEQPADAVVREVFEETGIHVEVERLGGVATHPVRYPNGDECNYLHVWFHCRPVGGAARADGDESLEVGWFERSALPDLDDWSQLRLGSPDGWFAEAGAPPPPGLCDPYAL